MSSNLRALLDLADENETSSSDAVKRSTFDTLNAAYVAHKGEAEFVWRLARAEYNYAQTFLQKDEKRREKLIMEGENRCFQRVR